jgi:hypothetical protein
MGRRPWAGRIRKGASGSATLCRCDSLPRGAIYVLSAVPVKGYSGQFPHWRRHMAGLIRKALENTRVRWL